MHAADHLPPEVKNTIGFKLAVYIFPGVIFALVAILVIVPAPKPKHGLVQGHVSAQATSTLVVIPVKNPASSTEIVLSPNADYKIDVPAGDYQLKLKETDRRSGQLPRTLTISPNTSAIFDITLQ